MTKTLLDKRFQKLQRRSERADKNIQMACLILNCFQAFKRYESSDITAFDQDTNLALEIV